MPLASPAMTTAEQERLNEIRGGSPAWRRWGTFLSERAWGTVREDYSADGDAWNFFPFEHARSRTYRWNEDGLAGWCDDRQILCFGLALWNGRDSILKERPFGLTNEQGNHGEDVKDYWFYTDNLPTHAYASMTYKYPQAAFPYEDLKATNASRGQDVGEYELFDALESQWRENRYFDVVVEYAKPDPEDVVCRITVTNRGPESADIHVLPQVWFRNTWRWNEGESPSFLTRVRDGVAMQNHPELGRRWIYFMSSTPDVPRLMFTNNETNNEALFSSANDVKFVKDGIDEAIVHGRATTDDSTGSKMAAHVTATLAAGESMTVTWRFAQAELALPFDDAETVLSARRDECDEFFHALARSGLTPDEQLVQRQALAGLLWSKQYYHYAVRRWLQGDPTQPEPPSSRWHGRNSEWQHLVNRDVILMPDSWEYPWFAAWDLAFHCVTMALIDPDFAKGQVLLLLNSLTQHPHGQIPAYEWNFGDTNPPLHAWAAWQVFQMDRAVTGVADHEFLAAAYRSVTLDVMWWLNQKDADSNGVFGGGFLGMDNIGVFDRDEPLPTGGSLAQIDGTSWMAALIMQMLEMTVELTKVEQGYDRMFGRWVWDAWLIANAIEKGSGTVSFWNDETGFYHDVIELPDGESHTLEVFSMQSLTPLFAGIAVPMTARSQLLELAAQLGRLRDAYDEPQAAVKLRLEGGDGSHFMAGVVGADRLAKILSRVLDPEQFLSSHGIRSLSKFHKDHPYTYDTNGSTYTVAYVPAESENRMFGGNSNWRGPIWFPMNFLLVQSLNTYARFLGDTFTVPDPAGSGTPVTLAEVADGLASRLCSTFLRSADGTRPVFGGNDYFQNDEHWRDLVPFYEYFDGDDGRGLGASHQTGWTATVALLLQFGGALRFRG